MEINHEQLTKSIIKSYNTGKPLFISGTTGIGKSQNVMNTAKQIAVKEQRKFIEWNKISDKDKLRLEDEEAYRESVFVFVDYRISQISPEDLKGLPKLNGKDYVEWKPTLLFRVLSKDKVKALLFFDEMNLAPPSIQAAAYQIILDKCIGEIALNPDVCIIAAGNRAEDKANVFDMAMPLKARFRHTTLRVPSVEEWESEYAIPHGVQDKLIAFLKFRPDLLMADISKLKGQSAFPCPRQWDVVDCITKDETDLEEIKRYTSESVGDGVAIEYKAFLKLRDEIDLDNVLANPSSVSKLGLDMKWALISLVSERYRTAKKDSTLLEKALEFDDYMEPDFMASMLRFMKSNNKKLFVSQIFQCKKWPVINLKYNYYIKPCD